MQGGIIRSGQPDGKVVMMKKSFDMKKTACLLLALLLSLSAVSCGSEAPANDDDTQSAESTGPAVTDPRDAYRSMLPAVEDFGGGAFRILIKDECNIVRGVPCYYADEQTGETVNDALYTRNRMVEEDYGVEIQVIYTSDVEDELLRGTMAGDDFCDLAAPRETRKFIGQLPQGTVMDLNTLPEFSFDAPWWSKCMDELEFYGKQFFLIGDIAPSFDVNMVCVTFNQKLYDELGFENPYRMVNEGRWTFDKLGEMAKSVSRDLNGDAKITVADQIGLLTENDAANYFFSGSGEAYVRAEKGDYQFNFGSEKCFDAFDKVFELMFDAEHVFPINSGAYDPQFTTANCWTEATKIMSEDRALFRTGTFGDTTEYRDMKSDFGVLPIPKLDEKQENYCCELSEWCQPLVIPVTVKNVHRAALVTEALCMQGKFVIMPEFYEDFLGEKVLRDEESKKMIDLMFASATVNLDTWFDMTGLSASIRDMVKSGTYTLASQAAALQTSAQAKMKTVLDGIKNLK